MKNTIYFILLFTALISCKESAKQEETSTDETVVEEMTLSAPAAGNADMSKEAPDAAAYPSQKIIKNANLRFATEDLSATAETVSRSVKKFRAQIQNDSEGNNNYALTRNMTVRVPSQNFDAFIAEISKGVKYFDTKEISSEDVTEQYVDTEARIKAKKVLEARYLELIGKAKKVSEILEIEKELSAIREEIEAKEGQLRYMKSRVAMSTITLEFYKNIADEPGATVSYGSKMWNAVKSGFNGISSFFIGLLNLWPFILIFVIAFIIIRKKLKRKKDHDTRN